VAKNARKFVLDPFRPVGYSNLPARGTPLGRVSALIQSHEHNFDIVAVLQ